jgi:hypothetical protein
MMALDANLTPELVAMKVRAIFGIEREKAVIDQLATLSFGLGLMETLRLQLAILKLTEEEGVGRLNYFIEAGGRDYRDVLLWAEHPNEARLKPGKPMQLADRRLVRSLDRAQYRSWINK